MNDTHGAHGTPWYGFDLDGTLAVYDGWRGIGHIGAPVAPMVALIRRMYFTSPGLRVKILTARVAPRSNIETLPNPYLENHCPHLENHWCVEEPDERPWTMKPTWTALEFIQDWCWTHLGFVPEITHEKDHLMLNLFDDRVVQVEPNTGEIIGRMPPELVKYWENR